MEVYYDPETWDWDHDLNALASVGAFTKVCEEQRQKYMAHLRSTGMEAMDPEAQDDYNERLELGIGMLRYYFEKVAPVEDVHIKPLHTEIQFQVPVLQPEAYERFTHAEIVAGLQDQDFLDRWQLRCSSPVCAERHVPDAPVVFAGRLDLLLENIHDGGQWILDWKTAARLSGEKGEEFLLTDNAITAYCWALWCLGIDIRGFIYHEEKKAFPEPPKRNQKPYKGCMYSQNKQMSTTYDIYKTTVEEGDKAAYDKGLYNDMLAFLKAVEEEGAAFHNRFQVHRSATELANAGYYIALECLDMTAPDLRIYPQPGRFSCGGCAYRQPCIGQTAGEDYVYTLTSLFTRRDHYWIREEPSTDKGAGMD
jgi:hypothetical protein